MMSIYEFDEERHNRTLHEEGFEKGREDIINILLADGTITPERAEALRKETDVQNT